MHRLPRDCYKIWGSQWPPMLPALWNTQVSIKKRLLCYYNYEIWTKTVFFFGKYRTRLVCQCIACLGFSGKIMSVFWTLSLQMFSLFNRLRTIFFQYFSFDIAQTFEWSLSQHFLYFLMSHKSYSRIKEFIILSIKGQNRTHLKDDSEADLRWLGSKPPLEVPVVINEDIFCEINVPIINISFNNY